MERKKQEVSRPARKDIRLKEYHYSQAGCYFITICTKDRKPLSGQVVGDAALGVPLVALTKTGEMVKKRIEHINHLSDHYHLDHYVIMPNHIHLLISIADGTQWAASPTKAAVPQIINALKSLTSKDCGTSLWQRAYHDHVIRNEADYLRIWQYIDENTEKWKEDRYYTIG